MGNEQQGKQKSNYELQQEQEQLNKQIADQQTALDQAQRNYEAQIKSAQAGLGGSYGPVAEASHQNADGSWSRPSYQTMLDPATGLLKDNFQIQNTLDTTGLDQYRGEATRDPGTQSAWLKMAQEGENQNRLTNQNNLSAQLNAGNRSAMDSLAASGGLDSGSRLSLARSGLRDMMRGKQDINNQSRQNSLNLSQSDEENRIKMLSALPGMETQKSTFDANLQGQNINNAMNERQYAYNNEMDAWKKNQEVWGANKQAAAQKSSSGGCFSGDTLITMDDSSKKAIKDIKLGDVTLLGGEVSQILVGKSKTHDDWYLIHGVNVSGSHLILQSGDWIPAREYEVKDKVTAPEVYFNLTTKNHLLLINEVLFSDLQDVDNFSLTDFESLKAKNSDWRVHQSELA